jgi:hypothetical protein
MLIAAVGYSSNFYFEKHSWISRYKKVELDSPNLKYTASKLIPFVLIIKINGIDNDGDAVKIELHYLNFFLIYDKKID